MVSISNCAGTMQYSQEPRKIPSIQCGFKAMESVDKEVLLAILLSGMDSKTLIAKAFNSLAENSDKIGNLNISPDLLETLTTAGITVRN